MENLSELRIGEKRVLNYLGQHRDCTNAEMCKALIDTRGNIRTHLKHLQEGGMVLEDSHGENIHGHTWRLDRNGIGVAVIDSGFDPDFIHAVIEAYRDVDDMTGYMSEFMKSLEKVVGDDVGPIMNTFWKTFALLLTEDLNFGDFSVMVGALFAKHLGKDKITILASNLKPLSAKVQKYTDKNGIDSDELIKFLSDINTKKS